ncbi:MAG: HYR domain-containing protein [Gaiellaceae bacterium]
MTKRLIPITVLAACALAAVAGSARADTVSLHAVFDGPFSVGGNGPVDCGPGTPAQTFCYPATTDPAIPGLGKTTMAFTILEDRSDPNPDCAHAKIDRLPIVVTGKGEIDLSAQSSGCQPYADPQPLAFTVTGGSGIYAGATGSGELTLLSHTEPPSPKGRTLHAELSGTLSVPGLQFDTTKPRLKGLKNLAVTTKSKRGKRVRFSVTATDQVDGSVSVSCKPPSGSLFRLGRTAVTCKAMDSSGNTATGRFTVQVKRR